MVRAAVEDASTPSPLLLGLHDQADALAGNSSGKPEVRARLAVLLAETLLGIGDHDRARRLLLIGLDVSNGDSEHASEIAASCLLGLAELERSLGRPTDARRWLLQMVQSHDHTPRMAGAMLVARTILIELDESNLGYAASVQAKRDAIADASKESQVPVSNQAMPRPRSFTVSEFSFRYKLFKSVISNSPRDEGLICLAFSTTDES